MDKMPEINEMNNDVNIETEVHKKDLVNEADIATDVAQIPEAPPFRKVMWQEIRRDPLALISLFALIIIIVFVYIFPLVVEDPSGGRVNILTKDLKPSKEYPLGTDTNGRDMRYQLIVGARNSFNISFAVTAIVGVVGILVGLIAGFYGGKIDNAIMRVIDFLTMLPRMMLNIVFLTLRPKYSTGAFIFIMSILGWMGKARLIRARTLQEGRLDYVNASKTLGTPNIVIIFREVFPNIVSLVVVNMTLTLASNMALETGLSFLGYGLPITTPSLGSLLSQASRPEYLMGRTWQWLPPAILVLVLTLAINFVGQALNRAADAKQRS